jgi:3-dehydroquinate synthase
MITIQSKIKEYTVGLFDAVLQNPNAIFSSLDYNKLMFFIDENVYSLYKNQINHFRSKHPYCIITATELNKDFKKLSSYYQKLLDSDFTRKDILVTIGGGILQDISGFIASTLYRGIKWVFIPTTLLSQADSCIGSKTSINFNDSKNLIGTFYPPDKIFIDVSFCTTLSSNYFNSGLGEIIKFHLLSDKIRYQQLKKYLQSSNMKQGESFKKIILSTLEIKKSYF